MGALMPLLKGFATGVVKERVLVAELGFSCCNEGLTRILLLVVGVAHTRIIDGRLDYASCSLPCTTSASRAIKVRYRTTERCSINRCLTFLRL